MLNLPNILTLSRIMAIPLLAWFLWWPGWEMGYLIAFALYCLMGITDYFDGYLARTSGTVSKLGIFLDPIADKIMVAAVILVLAAQGGRIASGHGTERCRCPDHRTDSSVRCHVSVLRVARQETDRG